MSNDAMEARTEHIVYVWETIKESIPQYEIEVPPPSSKSDSRPQIVSTIIIPNIVPKFKHNKFVNVMANVKNKYNVWNEILNHEIITGPNVNVPPPPIPVVQSGINPEMQNKIAAAIANAQSNRMNLNANVGDFTSKSNAQFKTDVENLRNDNLSLIATQTELSSQLQKLKQMGLDKIKQDIANQTFTQIFAQKEKMLQTRLLEMQKLRIIEKTNNILNASSSQNVAPVVSQNDSLLNQIKSELELAKDQLAQAQAASSNLPNDTTLTIQLSELKAEMDSLKLSLEQNQQPLLPSQNDSLLIQIRTELEQAKQDLAQAKQELAQAKQDLAQAPPMPPNDTTLIDRLTDQLTALQEELALAQANQQPIIGTNLPSQNDPLLTQIKNELESAKRDLESAKVATTPLNDQLTALQTELELTKYQLAQAKLELEQARAPSTITTPVQAQAQAQDPALSAIRAELELAKEQLELAKAQPTSGSDLQVKLAACETEKEEFKQKLLNICKQQIIEKAKSKLISMNYKSSASSASASITFGSERKAVLVELLKEQNIKGGAPRNTLFMKGGAPKSISFPFDESAEYLVIYNKTTQTAKQYPECDKTKNIPCITYATEEMVEDFKKLKSSLNASGSKPSSSLMSALVLTKIALQRKSLYEDIVKKMNAEINETIKAGLPSALPGAATSSSTLSHSGLPGAATSASIGGKTGLMGYVDPIASFTKVQ